MSLLVETYYTDTDFDVCIFSKKEDEYCVTEYDNVYNKHEFKEKFKSLQEAEKYAQHLANQLTIE